MKNVLELQETAKQIGMGMALHAWENRDAPEAARLYFAQYEIAAIAAIAYKAGFEDAEREK